MARSGGWRRFANTPPSLICACVLVLLIVLVCRLLIHHPPSFDRRAGWLGLRTRGGSFAAGFAKNQSSFPSLHFQIYPRLDDGDVVAKVDQEQGIASGAAHP